MHLSDMHISERLFDEQSCSSSAGSTGHDVRVFWALDEILKSDELPWDLLVLSGDVSNNGDPQSFVWAKNWLEGQIHSGGRTCGLNLKGSPPNYVIVPGNADRYDGQPVQTNLSAYLGEFPEVKPAAVEHRRINGTNVAFHLFDSSFEGGGAARGRIDPKAMKRREMTKDALHVAVLHHHLIQPPEHARDKTREVENSREAAAFMLSTSFDALLFGHTHRSFVDCVPRELVARLAAGRGARRLLEKLFPWFFLNTETCPVSYHRQRARDDKYPTFERYFTYIYLEQVGVDGVKGPRACDNIEQFNRQLDELAERYDLDQTLRSLRKTRMLVSMAPSACQGGLLGNGFHVLRFELHGTDKYVQWQQYMYDGSRFSALGDWSHAIPIGGAPPLKREASSQPPTVPPDPPKHASAASRDATAPWGDVLFCWLHLSDIHFGQGNGQQQWDQRLVLDQLEYDISQSIEKGAVPTPNAVIVTGDIAYTAASRSPDEYNEATAWLQSIRSATRLTNEDLFVVAGNHDVQRKADQEDSHLGRIVGLVRSGAEEIDSILSKPADAALLRRRFANYFSFANQFGPREARDADISKQPLFWRHDRRIGGGLRLRISGLNTAIVAADDKDHGKLRLGTKQIATALLESGRTRDDLVHITLSHHPFHGGWLADEANAATWMNSHADVHLSGHIHKPSMTSVMSGGGSQFVRVEAGAAHALSEAPSEKISHAYNVAALVRSKDGALMVRIWPRLWSPDNAEFRVDRNTALDRKDYAEAPITRLGRR